MQFVSVSSLISFTAYAYFKHKKEAGWDRKWELYVDKHRPRFNLSP
jgi:hypothetical protein